MISSVLEVGLSPASCFRSLLLAPAIVGWRKCSELLIPCQRSCLGVPAWPRCLHNRSFVVETSLGNQRYCECVAIDEGKDHAGGKLLERCVRGKTPMRPFAFDPKLGVFVLRKSL